MTLLHSICAYRSRLLRLIASLALVGATAISVGAAAAGAQTAIGPKQHFVGIVNGQIGHAVVYTVCPGPIRPGQLGPLAGGQTFEVAEAPDGSGYTGPFSQISSWFVPPPGGVKPVQVKFTKYGVSKTIPSKVRVPCAGTGQAEFSSCPYLAPCASGWVPDYVTVTFEDIAV
jgi:hypothetical protein